MEAFKRILLVEDESIDIELTLAALAEYHPVNEVAIVRHGVEALDYFYCRGKYAQRPPANPVSNRLDLKIPRADLVQVPGQIKAEAQLGLTAVAGPTSSREPLDLQACYRLGAIAYKIKPVRFTGFVGAVKQTGAFRALINHPSPTGFRERAADPINAIEHVSI